MEEFYSQPGERQEKVFELMNVIGTQNIEVAYFLLKETGWNLEAAIEDFFGGGQEQDYHQPPMIQQPSNSSNEEYQNIGSTIEEKIEAFNEAFPSLHLNQQVSDTKQQRMKKISSNFDEDKLNKYIDSLIESKAYGDRLRTSTADVRNNKAFIMFLNATLDTKIGFSFGSFTSNLALAFLKKKPLLVYIHNEKKIATGLLRALLQDPAITSYINQNFVVYGMFDNSNDYGIVQEDMPLNDLPGVGCYYHDDKLNKPVYLGGHKLTEKNPLDILKFLESLVEKFRLSHPKKQAHSPKEEVNIPPPHQIPSHSIIEEQDLLYHTMEAEFKMKREVSKMNKEGILKKKELADKHRQLFEMEPEGKDTISIVFRLPSGSNLKRRFNLNDKVEQLFNYVDAFGSEGFENPHGEFDLIQTYPPLYLDSKRKDLLSSVFAQSSRENLIIKEK